MKEAKLLSLNIDKASFELGWEPTLSFEQTIDFISEWYSSYITDKHIITNSQIYNYTSIARSKGLSWA